MTELETLDEAIRKFDSAPMHTLGGPLADAFGLICKHARENAEHLAEIAKILETQTRHLETIAAHIQRSA